MAILNVKGHPRTANQFAKELVLRYGDRAFMWQDHMEPAYYDQYTEKQEIAVSQRVEIQYERVRGFLGDPDDNKVAGEDDDA